MTGRLFGVGVGPGDPELMTLKAARVLAEAGAVAYFCKRGRPGHARTIAAAHLRPGVEEIALAYPMTTEVPFDHPDYQASLRAFYEGSAGDLGRRLDAGHDIALLCEGDPLFYGSFMHLYVRLVGRCAVTIVPGVTGMSGCWTAAGAPVTWGDDVLTVLPGTLPAHALAARLAATDACVIMKLGRHFPKVRDALRDAGLAGRAIYVERGTMAGERVLPLCEKAGDDAPYFSLIVVPGQGRRP